MSSRKQAALRDHMRRLDDVGVVGGLSGPIMMCAYSIQGEGEEVSEAKKLIDMPD